MKFKNMVTTLIASFLFLITAIVPSSFAKTIEIKVGSYEPEGHYLVQYVYVPYTQEIERRTNGQVKFKWYHGGSLVKAPQTYDAMTGGLVDMVVTLGVFTMQSRFPVSNVMTLPFLFDSTVQVDRVYQKAYDTIPEFRAEYKDIVMLGFHASDFFNLHIHKDLKAPRTLEDMKGLKICAVSKTFVEVTQLLGATPRSLKPEDAYMSLQRKAIDGCFWPTAPLAKWKLTDLTSHHTLVYGPFVQVPMAMAERTWKTLPPDVQAVFNEMRPSVTDFCGAIVDNRRASTLNKLKERKDEIYTLPDDEKARWVDAMKPMYDRWLNEMKEKGIDGEKILAQIRSYAKEYRGTQYVKANWWGDQWQE
ncbi:TRAP transporter substrate-binding protein DctP [bacterium]|nr:TRAP transporter substrate-binding protein DctP [bacterium]